MTWPSEPGPIERVDIASRQSLRIVRWEPNGEPTGPPWLLVHGLASNARLWDGVGAALAARGRRAVAVDQRGHGRSSKPDGGYDLPTVADDLALLVEALGWTEAAVAGQSWGGNVVVELAHRHPQLTAALVAVDGGTIRLADQWPDWEDCAAALAPPPLAGRPSSEIEAWVNTMAADWPATGRAGTLANFELNDDQTIAPWLTFERHLEVLRGLWEHDPFLLLPEIETPTLFIGAGPDESKRNRVEQAAASMPRGAVRWFPDAHHDVHAQHPLEIAELLVEAETRRPF